MSGVVFRDRMNNCPSMMWLLKASPTRTAMAFVWLACRAAAADDARELIADVHCRNGFVLSQPTPGKHVIYGQLKGIDEAPPSWRLLQWSSKFPLEPSWTIAGPGLVASNAAKCIAINGTNLLLAINSGVEYGARARSATAPWVHLLVEQSFERPANLAELSAARLHVEAKLLHSRNLHHGDYSPNRHAAQFQIFFTIQNRNRASKGHGDLLWFGVPIYDNRARIPAAFKAQDFGGTEKYIFTPAGDTFTTQSAHDGEWVVIDRDLRPLMRDALAAAWARGFLKDSREISDYFISGMNMGWELPGTFDVALQVRGLSLKVVTGAKSSSASGVSKQRPPRSIPAPPPRTD